MSIEKEYFIIDLEQLGDGQLFPFHMHVYNPVSGVYSPYLYANSPLTSSKKQLLEDIISKGGKLAVPIKQKRTLLHQLELKEDQIPDLAPAKVHELEQRRQKIITATEKSKSDVSNKAFHFKEQLANAAADDNYMAMISYVKDQLAALSPRVSTTTTLASLLSEELMTEDNFINRTVALSFLLAKGCAMTDDETLGDLVCAAFFSHLGYTQLPSYAMKKPQQEYPDSIKKDWKKHPGLSMHLLRKAQVELSPRCIATIEQHHERYDGQGFPQMKKGSHIEQLALILGAASHILEYTSGRVTGSKCSLPSFVMNIKNKNYLPGMECEFGPLIEESLAHLVDTGKTFDENKKVA